ncbi:protein ERGIC-53-like isoform X6 [Oryctolagus cuniculus]|uniref:protein ERGIC-53-like isoform X6 n=1 Tax=Oryctolagus cuniculus TaxID=9986 RepID=UPI00387A8321
MPGTRGPGPSLGLLLLLLLGPAGAAAPRRRFEYKLSFKGPGLAPPGAGMSFWSHHGDAILGLDEVRLAPSLRDRGGAVWSRVPVLLSAWEVEVQLRVTGPGRRGAQGVAVWYTRERGRVGSVLGGPASWDGIGILLDSSAGDTQDSPAIRVLAGDGHSPSTQLGGGASRVLGLCRRDFRNRPYPIRARITYWGQRLRVSSNSGLTPHDPDEVCVEVGPLLLAPGGFFGVSAATSTLADDHDVLAFLTYSLHEPGPEGKGSVTWRRASAGTAGSCRPSGVSLSSWPRHGGSGSSSWGPQARSGQREAGTLPSSAPCSVDSGLCSRPCERCEDSSPGPLPARRVPRGLLLPAAQRPPALPPRPDCGLLLLRPLQTGAGQALSGVSVQRRPSSGPCPTHRERPGGSQEAAPLPQHASLTTAPSHWRVGSVASSVCPAPAHTSAAGKLPPY